MKTITLAFLLIAIFALNIANATDLAPNKFVSVNGKKLPTRLWALVSENGGVNNNSTDWELLKNGSIGYESKKTKLIKIEFKFDEPINNMFILTMNGYAACIGNYLMDKKKFETFAVGWSKNIKSSPENSSTFSKIDLYVVGLNAGDNVSDHDDIEWMGLKGKIDIGQQKIITKNRTEICPQWIKPEYLGSAAH